MTKAEICASSGLPPATYNQAQKASERYVAQWLTDKTFSPDVTQLLELGKQLVVLSAGQRKNARKMFQLDRWDAGWYQIRNGLYGAECHKTQEMQAEWVTFQEQYKKVSARLRPLVYKLGFLPAEMLYEDIDNDNKMPAEEETDGLLSDAHSEIGEATILEELTTLAKDSGDKSN